MPRRLRSRGWHPLCFTIDRMRTNGAGYFGVKRTHVTKHVLERLQNRETLMNEFLLFALIVIYLIIGHGKSKTTDSADRQEHANRQSSQPGGER